MLPFKYLGCRWRAWANVAKIAQRGHNVTLCDLSSEMLKLAKVDIEKHGLLSQYQLVHSPVQEIEQHLHEKVDMVLSTR